MVLGLFLSGNVYAEPEKLPEGTTVNSLLKKGYGLFSTDLVATPTTYGENITSPGYVAVVYHLIKGKELITCSIVKGIVGCIKP